MFSNLIFLILVLLLITLAPDSFAGMKWDFPPDNAFLVGLGLYVFTLAFIYLQTRLLLFSRRLRVGSMLMLVNIELIIFLAYFHFFLGAGRFFEPIGYQTVGILYSLLMYLGGLAVFHATAYDFRRLHAHFRDRWEYASRELQLIIPFAIPFLAITFIADILTHTLSPETQQFLFSEDSLWGFIIVLGVTLLLILAMMIFLPYVIQKMWHCQPLPKNELKEKLEALCERAHFKHAGLKTWTVLDHALTAAIIGIVPQFRYIMFSKRLLKELPETSIEAILVHEIGHNYRYHLWFYPLIIFGVSILLSLITLFIPNTPSPYLPFALFILYGAVVVVYFRLVFGFFSRLFERQADLHVFELNIPPHYLIDAFDHIGVATGNSHNQPNWHHFSIRERIDFIKKAMNDPSIIAKHHRRTKFWLISYFVLLGIAIAALTYFLFS